MGYMTDGLTFNTLRRGNKVRLPEFKNNEGVTAHDEDDGSDWSLNDWAVAAVGEIGEACNVLKKVRRGDLTLAEARPMLRQEFADVVIYLDLLAGHAGIDLGEAVMETFNAKSVKVGSRVRLAADDYHLVALPNDTQRIPVVCTCVGTGPDLDWIHDSIASCPVHGRSPK